MTTLESPAKLTMTLSVTGLRADGYHLIDAEMVALDLHDTIDIKPSAENVISVDGPFAHNVPTDHRNLVWKALDLAGVSARVHITKNIPHGGGLGGGSANAAAILRWAQFTDYEKAAAVGADIPFCMVGGRATVTGIGEIIAPLTFEERNVTLIVPPVNVSTPIVYRMWDSLGGPTGEFGNDLEPAALAAFPELAQWRDRIESACGQRPRLAGSGATWFLEGHVRPDTSVLGECVVVHTKTRPDAGRVQ